MKIAILDMDNLKNPFWGSGQARVTREIGKRLCSRHEIVVYCSRYPGYKDYAEDGIQYKHIGLGSRFARLNNIAYLFAAAIKAMGIKADLIIENFNAPVSTGFIPLFTKISVVALPSFFAPEEMFKKYKIPFHWLTKIGIKFYKYAICLTQRQQQKIKEMNPVIASVVIPNGVDEGYFQSRTSEKDYILFMGRIDIEHKGLDLLVHAFNKAKSRIKDDLCIMGSGSISDQKKLEDLIVLLGLGNRVKLLGRLDGEEKMKYLSESKFMVCPSRHESQNLSSLEAMAMGKSLVCFKIPGLEWIPDHLCLKAKPFSVDDYAEYIVKMGTDRNLRQELGKHSKEFAKNYDWTKSAIQYEQFFMRVKNRENIIN